MLPCTNASLLVSIVLQCIACVYQAFIDAPNNRMFFMRLLICTSQKMKNIHTAPGTQTTLMLMGNDLLWEVETFTCPLTSQSCSDSPSVRTHLCEAPTVWPRCHVSSANSAKSSVTVVVANMEPDKQLATGKRRSKVKAWSRRRGGCLVLEAFSI